MSATQERAASSGPIFRFFIDDQETARPSRTRWITFILKLGTRLMNTARSGRLELSRKTPRPWMPRTVSTSASMRARMRRISRLAAGSTCSAALRAVSSTGPRCTARRTTSDSPPPLWRKSRSASQMSNG